MVANWASFTPPLGLGFSGAGAGAAGRALLRPQAVGVALVAACHLRARRGLLRVAATETKLAILLLSKVRKRGSRAEISQRPRVADLVTLRPRHIIREIRSAIRTRVELAKFREIRKISRNFSSVTPVHVTGDSTTQKKPCHNLEHYIPTSSHHLNTS